MPNGLLYIAILVLWAVVLIPMWLRRQERTAEHRTTRRFRHAMSTLDRSRRTRRPVDVMLVSRSGSAANPVPALVLDSSVDLHLDHGVDPFVDSGEEHEVLLARRADSRRVAVRIAAARRRRTLVGLLVLAGLGLALGALGVVPLVAVVVPVAAAIGFLVLARMQVRSQLAQDHRWAQRMRDRRSSAQNSLPLAPVVPVRRRLEVGTATSMGGSKSDVSAAAAADTSYRHPEAQIVGTGTASPGAADVRVLTPSEVAALRSGAAGAASAARGPQVRTGARPAGVRGYVAQGGKDFFTVEGPRPAVSAGPGTDVMVPGSLSKARMLEQVAAISATHEDVESELGLDSYAYPSEALDRPPVDRPRAVNE